MKRLYLFTFLFCLFVHAVFAVNIEKPLTVDTAFQLSVTAKDEQTILFTWKIAPHYFLYRQHFAFHVIKPATTILGTPFYPSDVTSLKIATGTYDVYSNAITILIPVIKSFNKYVVLQVQYQGCSSTGYCYPPITKIVSINLASNFMLPATVLDIDVADSKIIDNPINTLLATQHLIWIIISFVGFGLLLSFTPCVLPMIPILSSMIIGKHKMTHAHAFSISLFYVLGMAITYACAGVLFGFIGSSVQMLFQKPFIIILFSLLFVAMALSLFGAFNVQLPEKLQNKITNISRHQKSGTYAGAFIMGVLSTLIVSPCVTPPLVAALGFISHSGNAGIGGIALFSMGLGMGIPLLLIGAIGPKVLPHAGPWMNVIKIGMGVLLLIVAITMTARVFPNLMNMKFSHNSFQSVQSIEEIDQAIQSAKKIHKPALLDFYANWCIACQELEKITFQNDHVQKTLTHFVLLKANISQNNLETQRMMHHFDIIGPPVILFFKDGQEIKSNRLVGFIPPDQMLSRLNEILKTSHKI